MAKSKAPRKQVDPAQLAEEIATGRTHVRLSVRSSPITLSDALSEGLKAFQPSAWKAPRWRMMGNGWGSQENRTCGYVCEDPFEQAFAIDVMMLTGFSIPEFDLWLDKLPPSGARDELAVRRHWIGEALVADEQTNVRRHLEWLVNRRREIEGILSVLPAIERDARLQNAQHNPRGSHMPKLDKWLRDQNMGMSNDALFAKLKRAGHSLYDGDLYVEDSSIVELDQRGREHGIGRRGFDKRVTAARKAKGKSAASN